MIVTKLANIKVEVANLDIIRLIILSVYYMIYIIIWLYLMDFFFVYAVSSTFMFSVMCSFVVVKDNMCCSFVCAFSCVVVGILKWNFS